MKKLFTIILSLIVSCSIAQWYPQTSGTTKSLNSVCFTETLNGWAVGDSGIILHTVDGGDNWAQQPSGTDFNLGKVRFNNNLNGWIAGGMGGVPQTGIILHTINGGGTWEEMFDTTYYLNDVSFPDTLNGWVVGESHIYVGLWGFILHSNDGGETWIQDSIVWGRPLRAIHFVDPDNGWIVGGGYASSSGYYHCIIMNTNDGGITWNNQFEHNSRKGYYLFSVYFTDSLNGWSSGGGWNNSKIILKTNDGGNNWDTTYFNNSGILHSNCFADSVKGWAVGSSGTIIHTSNGGDTWEEQPSETTNYLNSVCFTNTENGWIVGDSGTILFTDNGGTTGFEIANLEDSSDNINIFPNPFTTSTTLSYELQQPEKVSLSIYNHLGQMVYQIEENQLQGKQQLVWNAEGLPDGIYYYRLQAGDAVGNGKLVKVR